MLAVWPTGAVAAASTTTNAARTVYGFVTVAQPVEGATISVYSTSGRLLAREPNATSATGTFAVAVDHLPSRFRIVSSGGRRFDGRLEATVARRPGEVTDLNPVTTIISRYLRGHSSVSLASAEARVETLLGIPLSLDPDTDLRLSEPDFSGRSFLAAARRAGGLDRLTTRLVRRVGSASRRGFSARPMFPGAAIDTEDIAEKLFDELIANAKKKAGDSITGWLLASLKPGQEDATQAQLKKISAQLEAINQQLVDIKARLGQIEGDLKQLGYQAVIDHLPLAQIDHFENEQTWIASAPASVDRDHAIAELAEYIRGKLTDAPELFQRAYTGGYGGIKLIPAYGQVALKLGPNNPLFTVSDSRKVTLAERYFESYLIQGVDAIVELQHQEGESQRPADLLKNVAEWRKEQFKPTYPQALPNEPVLVDGRTRLMWTTDTQLLSYKNALSYVAAFNSKALKGWGLASAADLRKLVSDTLGAEPCAWVASHGFKFIFEGHVACGSMWTNEAGCQNENKLFGFPFREGEPGFLYCDNFPGYRDYVLAVRRLGDGERYW